MAQEALQAVTENDSASVTGRSIRLPQWLAMALITWLFASSWFAASASTKLDNAIARLGEEHQATETYRLEVQALRKEVAYLTGVTTGRGQKGD